MAGKRRDIPAVDNNAARVRADKHVDASQKRAFSRASAADNAEHLTLRYVKRDRLEPGRLRARELTHSIDYDHVMPPIQSGSRGALAPHTAAAIIDALGLVSRAGKCLGGQNPDHGAHARN